MIRDTALLQHIQMALIGIVVVAGMFYLWRSICRLEDKLERLQAKFTLSLASGGSEKPSSAPSVVLHDPSAHAFMQRVFGDEPSASFMMFSDSKEVPKTSNIVIEDVSNNEKESTETEEAVGAVEAGETEEAVDVEEVVADEPHIIEESSEVGTSDLSNPLSKSKLKKMNLDLLKDLCKERGLSDEGPKSLLIDRILGLVRD